jgi:ribosomal protein S18 acetylase RimI-like enzyme
MKWRVSLKESDAAAVSALVEKTGFFSAQELRVAAELVEETLLHGNASGYEFVLADDPDRPGELLGYTCFGPIPATKSSFDLYWIAVSPSEQGKGIGTKLIQKTERMAKEMKATFMFVDTSGREQYTPTRAFYERMGYHVEARISDFYAPGDDKVVYGKRL